MKNDGFAITGIIYTIMILFILLIVGLLAMFQSRKTVLDELKNKVLNQVTSTFDLTPKVFSANTASSPYHTFLVTNSGYYKFELKSSKVGSINGSTLTATIYLKEGEKLYLFAGSASYNSGNSEIRTDPDNVTQLLIRSTGIDYYTNPSYDTRSFEDISYTSTNNALNGQITITYTTYQRLNSDLNKVRYIKDCIEGSSKNSTNQWIEIKAMVAGENKALGKVATGNIDGASNLKVTDNNLTTTVSSNNTGRSCIVIDLERTYNLDSIASWHDSDNRIYYHRELSVSSDGANYKVIDNNEKLETTAGIIVSSTKIEQTLKIEDVYVPVKEFGGAVWARIFHHNNRSGSVLWSARAQVLTVGGYDALHKQSILNYLSLFKNNNNKYELMLEYPEEDSNKYNRWTQTTDFTESTTIGTYTNIHTDFTSATAPFTGLKFNGTNTVSSGATSWYYAIGATNKTTITTSTGGINTATTGILAYNATPLSTTVDLWVRIDDYLNK